MGIKKKAEDDCQCDIFPIKFVRRTISQQRRVASISICWRVQAHCVFVCDRKDMSFSTFPYFRIDQLEGSAL